MANRHVYRIKTEAAGVAEPEMTLKAEFPIAKNRITLSNFNFFTEQ